MNQGGNASVTVTVTRSGAIGNVTLSASGLPTGASAAFQQPGTGPSGQITIAAAAATLSGTYPLTIQATDGVVSASAPLNLSINLVPALAGPYAWTSTGPLISAIPDAKHPIISIKDPTAVFWNNRWQVYATTADTSGNWNMVYLNFSDWSQAAAAQPYYMDATPGFAGYHCAPELFYFTPQGKWYLVYQSGPPTFSTTSDPSQPSTWTAPQPFFSGQPSTVSNWIDFSVICDTENCYLFFTGDNGNFYRSSTSIADFPNGFSTPQIILQAANPGDLFEASRTYKLKGTDQYLTVIEAMGGSSGQRYFRAWLSDHLDGDWVPLANANSWGTPFLGRNNVAFDSGTPAWTQDFSHGDILRTGYDEQMEIDPANLQFFYQGVDPAAASKAPNYSQLPWQLGIATAK